MVCQPVDAGRMNGVERRHGPCSNGGCLRTATFTCMSLMPMQLLQPSAAQPIIDNVGHSHMASACVSWPSNLSCQHDEHSSVQALTQHLRRRLVGATPGRPPHTRLSSLIARPASAPRGGPSATLASCTQRCWRSLMCCTLWWRWSSTSSPSCMIRATTCCSNSYCAAVTSAVSASSAASAELL